MSNKKHKSFVLWFKEVRKDDVAIVGGKGANLGEMTRAGFPVPNGFVVTAEAYFHFLKETGIGPAIAKAVRGFDPEDSKRLNALSKVIKRHILSAKMPAEIALEVEKNYKKLGDVDVAVRSSATAEDLPDASFAGQQETFLNTKGSAKVVEALQKCYASLFDGRAIYYRAINHYDQMKVGLAVPVQIMIQSERSGIMFTVDPVTGDTNSISIEAGFGLGEAIVSGSVIPDRYIIDKSSEKIVSKEINSQPWQVIRAAGGGDKHIAVPVADRKDQKLTDAQILDLAKLGKKIEMHYNSPQDIEFAIAGDKTYLVQSRPITTLKKSETLNSKSEMVNTPSTFENQAEVLLHGAAASVGVASGSVKIIHSREQNDQIQRGDILVTEMTTPDFVPAMKRAKGIITDTGGRTCHASIVSREFGIPCVVGTGTATVKLKNGQIVTIDGAKGLVYKGSIAINSKQQETNSKLVGSAAFEEIPITGTKVYVNLAEPEVAAEAAKLPVDGVGLLRAEFMIAGIGEHPKAMIAEGRGVEFTQKLSQGIGQIASAFAPRSVVYRATDFKTNEYRGLKGGEKYEPQEDNPMIGMRGALRYITDPEVFNLELEAIKIVRNDMDLTNLHLMIPFVRTVDELRKCKNLIEAAGLVRGPDFKLWMMVEVPSNVILLEKFLAVGIDGVSLGTNDLTQLMLGCDRDNQLLAKEFDERDEAISLSVEYVIKTCRKHGVTISVCGQAPSIYPEFTELMVRNGATSVSVTPDVAIQTRKIIASVEKRLLMQNIIDR
ncbi:phosphoenolpyruvate synthase [Candidatus Berkelbacteria bacterium CG08_land_8_20_14_0_20_39_8]|uniref:Phosphoenolpyruvate synthase n=1 Tax=Candidatus Berkelbacteria bacterium CG08_land_8_20_14_0_20_39_8 TaxID=1974511 RepID=A0A2M6YBT4_9BACT|nr:MAG: phosphoenolpyruvate synthase [Candidatus Berkelbacteria bacterium CG08_land_8_20_14_0_20_39_8]